jgi:hypothetical protein
VIVVGTDDIAPRMRDRTLNDLDGGAVTEAENEETRLMVFTARRLYVRCQTPKVQNCLGESENRGLTPVFHFSRLWRGMWIVL